MYAMVMNEINYNNNNSNNNVIYNNNNNFSRGLHIPVTEQLHVQV